jgi:hypothetical protein
MKIRTSVILAIAGIMALMNALDVCAQTYVNQPPAGQAQPAPSGARFTAAQLDQMLAPIALYPDALLGQILMASTYPLEIVEADRWVKSPRNAALTGSDLDNALKSQPWDPSVKSLVPFPQILHMMDNNLSWTEQLGDAFLAEQPAVMDSVQHLRKEAEAAGNLRSTHYETVTTEGSEIIIEPAEPDIVFVPVYDPFVVFGAWPFPAFPPFFFPGFFDVDVVVVGGVGFFGVDIDRPFWGWNRWDWDRHEIFVDRDRFNEINVNQPPIDRDTWRHDPFHRHGVPYRDEQTRDRFQAGGRMPNTNRFRGYPMAEAPQPRPGLEQRRPGLEQPRPGPERGREAAPREFRAPQARAPSPPAFESYGRGEDVRTQSERGYASRHSAPMTGGRMPRFAPRGSGRRFNEGNSGFSMPQHR